MVPVAVFKKIFRKSALGMLTKSVSHAILEKDKTLTLM